MKPITELLKDIKIQHTVFALPFAMMSAFIAANGAPGWRALALIVCAMVFSRSAAMAFNRLADERYDVLNPRTRERALPMGSVSRGQYAFFTIVCCVGFIAVCAMINDLALWLSPFALMIVFLYSYTKRFTPYSHFFLGLALALAPIGAWVAIHGQFALSPFILGVAVMFWLAGLDIIYSCQDIDFDREHHLQSIPQKYGVARSLNLAAMFHAIMIIFLVALSATTRLSWLYYAGLVFTAAMLFYEHSLVRPDDLKRINVAFFNVNGVISAGLALFTIADTIVFR
ncbi:Menaquinone via futalosine polyprenyltransferase (MenA homolog) [hydrothermal vent metagenome]|uniref:Menaquinone via futalosine polyprenyltransferase (MenA homolog) n=1 Tax=hydrothermal vent metagenome TaxID=652676 RepID=A0A3B1D5M7_9ZZZZ